MKKYWTAIVTAAILGFSIRPVVAIEIPYTEFIEGIYESRGEGVKYPILVPRILPTDQNLFWKTSISSEGYHIDFGYKPDCVDSTPCNWGSFSAELGGEMPGIENNSNTTSEGVTLAKGKKGIYVFYRSASYHARVFWKEKGILYTAYIKNGAKSKVIAMANSAIDPQGTSENSGFNAEIIDPPTNCRSNPGSGNPVQQVLQRGDILVNRSNPRYDTGGSTWYQEKYLGCWIHESQIRFK